MSNSTANGNLDWLDRAAQEARDMIDRLYAEGHRELDTDSEPPSAGAEWPAETEPRT